MFKDVYVGARKNGKELKLAFSEYYLSLVIVQDYQKFNLTGFRKINKKFDKNFFCDLGKEWFDSKVKESELNEGKDIENLITKVINYVVLLFCQAPVKVHFRNIQFNA